MSVVKGRQTTGGSVLLILGRARHQSRSANAISDGNRKFFLTPSYLVPLFRVTPFEFIENFYGS